MMLQTHLRYHKIAIGYEIIHGIPWKGNGSQRYSWEITNDTNIPVPFERWVCFFNRENINSW